MDDLLDLNWVDSTPQKNKPTSSTMNKKPDAFADLISTPTKKSVDISKLSLLERQRLQQQQQQQQQQQHSPVSWNTTPQSPVAPRSTTTPLSPSTPLRGTPSPTVLNNSKAASTKSPGSFTNTNKENINNESSFNNLLDPFTLNTSKPRSQDRNTPLNQLRNVSTPDSNAGDSWDFDLLDSKLTSIPVSTTNSTATPTSTTDPFDVDELAQHTSSSQLQLDDQDDNPLGILAQPAATLQQKQSPEDSASEFEEVEHIQDNSHKNKITLSEEEEDVKLAQLIDMGFSLQESKFAIEATLGQDMQAAIDLLIQNSETSQRLQPSSTPTRSENQRARVSQSERARNALFDEDTPTQHTRGSRESVPRQTSNNDDAVQVQTEKIVTQAQELGGFIYKNAASYFKAGRDRVSKAVGDWQEQQRTQRLEEQKGPIRPKWMMAGDDIVDVLTGSAGGFKDDDDDESETEQDNSTVERRRMEELKRQQKMKEQENAAAAHKARQKQQLKKDLLFDDDQTTYVSPSRRRGGTPKSDRSMSPALSKNNSMQTSTPPPKKPTPQAVASPKVNKRTRPVVSASPDVLSKASNARNSGNEKFKVGQFGDAEEAYTQAINILPSGHDFLVLLYNNRAATRLKTGDYKKCIEDCDIVFDLCNQSGDGSVTVENVSIQWREQLVKSLYRKAEAFENIEKYNDALTTYDQLIKYEGTSNTNINQRMSRCRQALNPKKSTPKPKSTLSQTPKPQKQADDLMAMFDPTKSSSSTVSTPVVSEEELSKSKAVAAMRAKAAEKEAEDVEKLQKVDDVNARILAWKGGKEQNLRALLATLDTLLWPGAQWKGAQMSELINPKKCKITYMKAISKVHPDKLPSDATVEHRMLASGIFSSLNEAWDSFKGQNQL